MIFENETFYQWILRAIPTIDESIKLNYYHTLLPDDPSPIVIHSHAAQCSIVISGKGYTELNGIQSSISTGSIVLIEAGMSHKFWADCEPLTLFHIHLPYETMDSDREVLGNDFSRHM